MASSFAFLGMPMAAMGVAWPSAAEDLGRSLGELGLVTLAYGAGYTASTMASGELTHRFTTSPLLIGAAFVAAGSLALLAATSVWAVFLIAVLLVGIAGGTLDAAVNSYVAVHRGARSMGIIHTGFGIGSALGPLFVTLFLAAGASWRIAPVPWLAAAALAVSGFAHGSMFPLEMLLTAKRFGSGYTPWAVGYEIAGANVGVAILSGGIGLFVTWWGVDAIAPTLVVFALLLLAAIEALRNGSSPRRVARARTVS